MIEENEDFRRSFEEFIVFASVTVIAIPGKAPQIIPPSPPFFRFVVLI